MGQSRSGILDISILNPIRSELKQTDKLLAGYLKTPYEEIKPLNRHTTQKTGKKLRPAITILFSRMCGLDEERMLKLGACFELLHTSTLIHDDVIDNANTRRGQETHNSVWSNTMTVLYGDFVFSSAMQLAVELEDIGALQQISRITRELVSGELLQNANTYRFPPDNDRYFEIIRLKTAVLFGGCCGIPVLLTQGAKDARNAFKIGEGIGFAFQIIDDCLDYIADERLGKPRLIDLAEGKTTLPVLMALDQNNHIVKDIVTRVFDARQITLEDGEQLINQLRENKYLEQAIDVAKKHIHDSLELLDDFPEGKYRNVFQKICKFITQREF